MSYTILFFCIGFASSIVGFAAGFFAGDKTAKMDDVQ